MKRLLIPLLFFCLLLGGCAGVNNVFSTGAGEDVKTLEKALTEVFIAYNVTDGNKANEILMKWVNPEVTTFDFGGVGLQRLSIDGVPGDYNNQYKNIRLDDHNIDLNGDSACVTGYVSGSITRDYYVNSQPVKTETLDGPWRMTSYWIKTKNGWQIKHLDISQLSVPKLQYYVQLPSDYEKDPGKKRPMILFLHGIGERGYTFDDCVKSITSHSIPHIAMTDKSFPFIVISPMCPSGTSWVQLPYSLINVVDEAAAKYNADPDRIYLTGISMGGMGVWSLAMQYPEKFAAIAPVCGKADPAKVDRIKNIPVWAFHGAKDDTIPLALDQKVVDALKACGGNVKFTVYPDIGHECWNKAYDTKELYTWFLQHTSKK